MIGFRFIISFPFNSHSICYELHGNADNSGANGHCQRYSIGLHNLGDSELYSYRALGFSVWNPDVHKWDYDDQYGTTIR